MRALDWRFTRWPHLNVDQSVGGVLTALRRTERVADTKTCASLRGFVARSLHRDPIPAEDGDVVFASRSGETPIIGYRQMWLRIAMLSDLPSDITPHVRHHSFASRAADLGFNEPTIASCSATRCTAFPIRRKPDITRLPLRRV